MNKVEKIIDRAGPLISLCACTPKHTCAYMPRTIITCMHVYAYIHILKTTPKSVSVLDSSGIHIFSLRRKRLYAVRLELYFLKDLKIKNRIKKENSRRQ